MPTTDSNPLTNLLPEWHSLLQGWALDGSLSAAAQEALVLNGTPEALQDLLTQWGAGDFSAIPPIVLLSSAEMNGAMGAYAISTGTIYLNTDWLTTTSKERVFSVLTEELGHHLDGLLNVIDTPGDEGEYFARLLGGEDMSVAQKDLLKARRDSGSVTREEAQITVETAAVPVIRGNSLYTTVEGPSWTKAEENSIALGGHLGSIADEDEQEFLWTAFGLYAFIGLTDEVAEGVWEWSDGSPVTYTNWSPTNPDNAVGPGGITQDYVVMGWSGATVPGQWDDQWHQQIIEGLPGIAEIPLQLSIDLPPSPKEGAGVFTTTINLSAGTGTNLAEGAVVYWKITGITGEDLDPTSPNGLSGSGTIVNGQLQIQHALTTDVDKHEILTVSVYSDLGMTHQIGALESSVVQESAPIIRGNSLYMVAYGPSWIEAELNSLQLGGHLVTVNNQPEDLFLQSAFLLGSWMGINDQAQEGVFQWVSGESVTYTNWNSGEPNDSLGDQDFGWYNRNYSGKWDDTRGDGTWGTMEPITTGIAEVPLISSITLPTAPKEGAGVIKTSINVSAGTQTTGNLAIGAKVFWSITGISADDLESGDLTGEGFIDSNGQLQITHSLKDDGILETKQFQVSVYSDVSRTSEFRIGTTRSASIVDTGFTDNSATIYIWGTSGKSGTSKIESFSIVRTVTGTGKNRIILDTPTYTTLATFSNPGIDGITFNGGPAANTISAAGVAGDPSRPAFNGQTILDGKLGTDTITGGAYRNWLIGGGIFGTRLSTTTTAADTLIGTVGALDVFDLRTSDFSTDAYSATNTGSARIINYSIDQDWIVLAGTQGSYSFTPVQTTTGSRKNKVTTTTGYQIFSGTELVATVAAASGTTLTGNAATDLKVLYGQTGDPTQILFSGAQMFF